MAAKPQGRRTVATELARRISMRDVADAAGVSRSAVSLALQGHPSIPAVTRDRIHAAARQVGYRKNPLVAALMVARRSGADHAANRAPVAFLTSHVPPDSWRQVATHRRFHAVARARAAGLGFQLGEFSLGDPSLRPERVRAVLKARGIHGLLIAPLPDEQTRLNCEVTDFAVVGLGMSVHEPAIDRVADDHFYAAELAFARCRALGYQRVGLALAANISRRLEHRWWSGALVAQQALPAPARVPALMPETRDEIPTLLGEWIARHRVDAVVFAMSDAEWMARAPAAIGLVSLAVHDTTGKIAGIRQNEPRVAEDAVDLLASKLLHWHTGVSTSPRLQLVRGEWSDGLSAPGAGRNRRALITRS